MSWHLQSDVEISFQEGSHVVVRRHYHDGRERRSIVWIPSEISQNQAKSSGGKEDSNQLLKRAGFVRQAYSGIFHLLPLGLRVQDKIERLVDKHMQSLGASKVALSSLSSQDLWSRSGRLVDEADVFKFSDRKAAKWLLSPTHEEEITSLVGNIAQSYRDLPIKLYQVSRKYRDEPRPRQGLLRGREFLMKDLYTFDVDLSSALKTYEEVKMAYVNFFDELRMPYIVAKADSGNMGGSLSHEFHLPSTKGEDTIISCSNCDFVKNEELIDGRATQIQPRLLSDSEVSKTAHENKPSLRETCFATQDKLSLVKVFSKIDATNERRSTDINPYAVKAIVPEVALGTENPLADFTSAEAGKRSVRYMFVDDVDPSDAQAQLLIERDIHQRDGIDLYLIEDASGTMVVSGLAKIQNGSQCPSCSTGRVKVEKAIEIGHTFHLGTRYSEPLNARVAVDHEPGGTPDAILEMGCHGIGVSRLIAAAASILSDEKGLNWPRAISPYEVIIIPHKMTDVGACDMVYDLITGSAGACNDAIIDDRTEDWLHKLRGADLIGYPVIIFLGRAWKERGEYEVQCRRLKIKETVSESRLVDFVKNLLSRL